MDTEFFKRLVDLIYVSATILNKPPKYLRKNYEISKRMEKTENVNEFFRDKNY